MYRFSLEWAQTPLVKQWCDCLLCLWLCASGRMHCVGCPVLHGSESQGMAWRDNAMTMATWRIAGCWQTGVAARALGDVNDARRRALSLYAMAPARHTERLSQDNTCARQFEIGLAAASTVLLALTT